MVTLLIDVMRSSVTKHATFDTENPYSMHSNATTTAAAAPGMDDGEGEYRAVDMPAVPVLSGSPPLMMCVCLL